MEQPAESVDLYISIFLEIWLTRPFPLLYAAYMTAKQVSLAALRPVTQALSPEKVDRVVAAAAAVLVLLALADPPQLPASLVFVFDSAVWIAPFFALSIAVAAYAKASGAEYLIARAFQGSPRRMILAAALFGSLSPFCSCGVIPLIAGLLGAGVPLAPVMAFWISSPLMDPEMFILMGVALGLPFTVGKTVAAFALGVLGGFATLAAQRAGWFADPLIGTSSCCAPSCASGVGEGDVVWKFWREPERWRSFRAGSLENGWFLGKWLTFAFLVESLMVAYIPASLVAETLGGGAWWTIPVSVVVGIPAYLNGYAAIPLMAELIDMGMMPGAAMAFMIAGGVTCIPAAIAVYALVRRAVFLWYFVISLTGSLAAGLLFQAAIA